MYAVIKTGGKQYRVAANEILEVEKLEGDPGALVKDVMDRMRAEGIDDVPVVVGGIIPPDDARALKAMGVAGVYTPKDFQINDIMADIVRLVERTPQAA